MLKYISPLDKPARLRFGNTVMVLLLYSTVYRYNGPISVKSFLSLQ